MTCESTHPSVSSPNTLRNTALSEEEHSGVALAPVNVNAEPVAVPSASPPQFSGTSLLAHWHQHSWLFLIVILFASISGMVIFSPSFVGRINLSLFGGSFHIEIEKVQPSSKQEA